jgi:hypothetical protein
MSYKLWFADYTIAMRKDRKNGSYDARSAVIRATDEGKYGSHVKHSVLGIGGYDTLVPWLFEAAGEERKLLKDMAFYATLEER